MTEPTAAEKEAEYARFFPPTSVGPAPFTTDLAQADNDLGFDPDDPAAMTAAIEAAVALMAEDETTDPPADTEPPSSGDLYENYFPTESEQS